MTDPVPAPEPWLWTNIKRLVYDQNYAGQIVRGTMGMIGLGVATGALTVPELPDSWGWLQRLIGVLLAGCAWWIRLGNDTMKTLANATDAELHAVGVATTPVPKPVPKPVPPRPQ